VASWARTPLLFRAGSRLAPLPPTVVAPGWFPRRRASSGCFRFSACLRRCGSSSRCLAWPVPPRAKPPVPELPPSLPPPCCYEPSRPRAACGPPLGPRLVATFTFTSTAAALLRFSRGRAAAAASAFATALHLQTAPALAHYCCLATHCQVAATSRRAEPPVHPYLNALSPSRDCFYCFRHRAAVAPPFSAPAVSSRRPALCRRCR
jgi:hypothetical protein